ncbi:WXG100 family type VII secretion target [Nonomuraea sp. NPDC059194]|uniref:WXG100 family type VII secretion target n=1 Tax=Nonomuraea sp. NPDC059194 TaxID=3346764 RepID=UPI0036BBB530
MASESNTYQIKSADKCETLAISAGGASAEQIKRWLNDTDAAAVVNAAASYANAASLVGQARDSLLSAAKALSEFWGGPTAALFQAGLQKLDSTGDELATKMKQVSTQLNAYGATHLPDAVKKAEAINTGSLLSPYQIPTTDTTPTTSSSTTPARPPLTLGEDSNTAVFKELQNQRARKVLEDLNLQIAGLYSLLPTDVSYDLEIPSPPSDGDYQQTSHSASARRQSSFRGGSPGMPTFYTGDDAPGGGAGGPGGGGAGQSPGSDPGSRPGSGGTDPTRPGGDGPSPSPQPPGTNPGTDTPPGTDPNPPGGNGSGTGSPGASPGNGTGDGRGDGTAPPVIGQDGSRQTETASYQPTQTTTTPTTMPTTSTPSWQIPTTTTPTITTPGLPNTFVGPSNGSPGVPSVIGGGTLGGPGGLTSAAARGGFGAGAPYLPMGTLGGPIGGAENEENTCSTNLREDRGPWSSVHEVTTDCIGRRAEE